VRPWSMSLSLVDVLKLLGNPTRFQIMEWLRTPEESFAEYEPIADREEYGVCVTHLAAKTGLSQPTISVYMNSLERAGLVESTRIGKWTHYRRVGTQVDELVEQLQHRLI
ncbi:metalloregulator ArsR/SmtB family transcription factor, partial [Arthrobacter zhaoguopingii]|uniref:ArsR/SmtB family transcription factor n=4 Tax=Arthrobacter zhaoguopingii TaxID=2681491 RepID=UPI0031B5E763